MMTLFEDYADGTRNWLPEGGMVQYYGKVLGQKEADIYLDALLTKIDWRNDEAIIFGKKIITKRKVAWYGDEAFEYSYSNVTKHALPWNDDLLALKSLVEEKSGETYYSCLLNLYHNGGEGMAWHSDAEKDLKKDGAIGSLSFGAERKFAFRHKQTRQKVEMILEHGSLLVMKGSTQTNWLHRLPPTKKVYHLRINLTFRSIMK
jgi:alkylated DNA repair dioxygenase AlkB